MSGRPRALAAAIGLLAIVVFASAGWLAWFSYDILSGLPDRDTIRGIGEMAQATTIYDAHDAPVFTIFKEQRIEVPLERVSPNLVKAVISVEDQRFYEHSGVDFVRTGAALLHDVHAGRRAQGGSTITQQLARQSFLSRDKTLRRKLKEAILAAHIENEYSKKEILELYLNKVYLGNGFYGVEAAARGYLGKPASHLTVDEGALLAGLIQSPSSYAPTGNMERAIWRRNIVLQAMLTSGAIDRAQYDRARRADVKLSDELEIKETFGLYFKEQVRRELVDRFGWPRVSQGGLKVYTTLDPELQQAAERILENGIEAIERRRGYPHESRAEALKSTAEALKSTAEAKAALKPATLKKGEAAPTETAPDYLQGALVALDPGTGAVRALVGGRAFNESRFNRVTQAKRQSGSAFKPFVYAAALEAGYSPASVISHLNDPILTGQGGWVPEDEHSSATSMTLRTALRMSSNRAAVQLLSSIGIPKAVSFAQKLNVGTPPSVPSLALGASDVTLLSLTAAYGAFADGGVIRTPLLIRRVEDSDGMVLYKEEGRSQRAISESSAFLMSSMLADVVNSGTAYRARQSGFTLPAAGKTGTTNDYVDAWFVGYTPHIVAGVWVGFDQPSTIISNGYAAELAVPIWASFMKTATKGDKADWFDKPANVVAVNVCRMSGQLPNAGCDDVQVVDNDGMLSMRSMVYTDYFVKGAQPTTVCPLHPGASFLDRLAGVLGRETEKPTPADEAGLPALPRASTSGKPAPAVAPSGAVAPSDAPITGGAIEQPMKKRGFWSRLFGVGGHDKKDKKDDKK